MVHNKKPKKLQKSGMQLVERKLERYLKIMCYSDSREIVFMSIGAAKAISDLLLDRGNGISITVKIN